MQINTYGFGESKNILTRTRTGARRFYTIASLVIKIATALHKAQCFAANVALLFCPVFKCYLLSIAENFKKLLSATPTHCSRVVRTKLSRIQWQK